ncbi:fimbrial protein [Gallibacterium anatis]|uniref:fimbrial protein n=1 Tax=Gallibacterium anatis TaxID=750 RepID=UPI003003D11D
MKKLFLTTLVLATSVTAFAVDNSKDGTVNFNGKLVDNTCEVNSNSKNLSIQLPTLPTRLLPAANDTAGLTLFQLQLDNCNNQKARAYFVPTPDKVDLASGRLINTASGGAAENVQVQLLDKDTTTVINATGTGGNQASKLQTINDSNNKLTYYARYYATGKTTAGVVTAAVDYYVEYE